MRRAPICGPVAALLACCIATGCASSPRPELMIYDGIKGAVYLARIEHKSFQATHPIKIEPQLIARVLRGIYVPSDVSTLQAMAGRESHPLRVFSDGDIEDFLAPLIAKALSQAAPDQAVGFRVVNLTTTTYTQTTGGGVGSSEGPPGQTVMETTGGLIYAHGLSLHFALTQYRHQPQKPDTIGGPNRYYPDQTGVAKRDVAFVPKEALRPESYQQLNVSGDPDVKTFVIDYQALAVLPEPKIAGPGTTEAAPPAAAAPTASELESVKESMAKKDAEVEALKKEMESIKKQLNEQQKSAQPKQKSKPAAKPAQ